MPVREGGQHISRTVAAAPVAAAPVAALQGPGVGGERGRGGGRQPLRRRPGPAEAGQGRGGVVLAGPWHCGIAALDQALHRGAERLPSDTCAGPAGGGAGAGVRLQICLERRIGSSLERGAYPALKFCVFLGRGT